MTIENYVEVNKEARNVTLHLNGIEIKLTYTRLRQLSADGLDDAIAEAHGFDTSAALERANDAGLGTVKARFSYLMRELENRFPGVVDMFSSEPSEPKLLAAIDRLATHNNAASVAAILFALEADEGMTWLSLWNDGEFEKCREEWPEAPDECYIGADPFFVPKQTESEDGNS